MEIKYSPSVNIIRDAQKHLNYHKTPNAERIAEELIDDFKKGIHAFTLIGSYGTGKSSFLWAFEQSLNGNHKYFNNNLSYNCGFLHWVGEHQSFIDYCSEQLEIENNLAGNQKIFDAIFQEYQKLGNNGFLVIMVDEFGKFLEFATENNPDLELYFIQQLAEFVNDPDRNIILLTTLHQNFEAYGNALLQDSQKLEWRKVKGRLKEITFNEPVEQLLYLASASFQGKYTAKEDHSDLLINFVKKHHLFSIDTTFLKNIGNKLYPLDIISAIVLTKALQRYGQNERSLFTFLQSIDFTEDQDYFNLSVLYDYLYHNFYSFINSKNNPHYSQWSDIRSADERVESVIREQYYDASRLVKAVGLIHIFKSEGAKIDEIFLRNYGEKVLKIKNVSKILRTLQKHKIIIYAKFKQAYKLFEGTDLDIEEALLSAGNDVSLGLDIVAILQSHFDFPIITAKSVSYQKGTPRLFEFVISDEPIHTIPEGQIDGFIDLIFNDHLRLDSLIEQSGQEEEAILYGHFRNFTDIQNTLLDIEKTRKVIAENDEDKVARRELETILKSNEQLLSHYVLDALYTDKIYWVFKGQTIEIPTKAAFNRCLSEICEEVYFLTPKFNNELLNKHKISSSIHTARKNYFNALVNSWTQIDLGFEPRKYPPEKTVYYSLLKTNAIHIVTNRVGELKAPDLDSSFYPIWNVCDQFLENSKENRKKLGELVGILSQRPYKLKQGLIDFWLPTYLFIKRGDYALYGNDGYIPDINETILYLTTRNISEYTIKAFEISDLRLKLFNKYRDFLQLRNQERISKEGFIDSIKPFLVFYRALPEYTKKTRRLSKEAIKLREAILNAEDPETTFFEDIPKAFNVDIQSLSQSDADIANYAVLLQEKIEELKYAYQNLLDRIEQFILDEVIGEKLKFLQYKEKLQNRFKKLKEHQLLKDQLTFLRRVNSPIDDGDSWLATSPCTFWSITVT